ncbi:endo-1,4-beta-glucanase, partial [Mariannaea sp. PMI_226]
LLALLASASSVTAHGFIKNIVINGASYDGYNTLTDPYEPEPRLLIGWANKATDQGPVSPHDYGNPDIICHRGAENAKGHAQVPAGDDIFLQWTPWLEDHKGPVLTYLAACGDMGCESVDKTSLEFFKISERGRVDDSTVPGVFAADQLRANGDGWMVQIPATIKPGFYVLRHEIIALHAAQNPDGAQNYPQCINLEITGSGTEVPDGVLGTALYKSNDPGIAVDIWDPLPTYVIPGPPLIPGVSDIKQTTSAIQSSATPTTGTLLA